MLARIGAGDDGWRIDVSAHPFSVGIGQRDSRVTTRYDDGDLLSVIAAMHEFGHALYERQIAPELARTNLGAGTSMSIHESQSKLWENHVGRHPAFAGVIAEALAAGGFAVEPAALHASLIAVRPSLIRVSADPVSYPLHIVLRFELELALIEGDLDVADLPAAWNDGMRRLLGIEVPDDADGVLQDTHWAAGAFGYFPSYALGCLIAAQLWEALERDLGPQDEALGRGDVTAIRAWLAEHVHAPAAGWTPSRSWSGPRAAGWRPRRSCATRAVLARRAPEAARHKSAPEALRQPARQPPRAVRAAPPGPRCGPLSRGAGRRCRTPRARAPSARPGARRRRSAWGRRSRGRARSASGRGRRRRTRRGGGRAAGAGGRRASPGPGGSRRRRSGRRRRRARPQRYEGPGARSSARVHGGREDEVLPRHARALEQPGRPGVRASLAADERGEP